MTIGMNMVSRRCIGCSVSHAVASINGFIIPCRTHHYRATVNRCIEQAAAGIYGRVTGYCLGHLYPLLAWLAISSVAVDQYSHKVVGRSMKPTLTRELVLYASMKAVW